MRNHRLIVYLGFGLSLMAALILGVRGQPDHGLTVHAEEGPSADDPAVTVPITDTLAANDLLPRAYLPLVRKPPPPIYLPLVVKPLEVLNSPLPPPIPMIREAWEDYGSIRTELQANGQDLAFVKIGFHMGVGGNARGLGDAISALDAAGVPVFLKSVDDAGLISDTQELIRTSGVPHTLVYRKESPSDEDWDVPPYHLSPRDAAFAHWKRHRDAFPPELDPSLVWIETVNEVDKNRSEWLAEFSLETARLVLAEDEEYRWAAFGWSSGEPEVIDPKDWEEPEMLKFLQLAGEHPDRIAIALHEYSYTVSDIADGYPYKVGRFQFLFDACDRHDIPRPTVLITEWGWEYQDIPRDVPEAMDDIAWTSWLYAAYPQVKGAAIWYLGSGFDGIADQAQQLIVPLTDYALSHYYIIEQGQGGIDPELFLPELFLP